MPDFGWRRGLKDPTAQWGVKAGAPVADSRIVDRIAQGFAALQVFEKLRCSVGECSGGIVGVLVLLTGNSEMGIGGYCFAHIGMLRMLADTKVEEGDDDNGKI